MSDGVTFGIPNWNHELLVARAVSSALAAVRIFRAAGIPAEAIVVDDASRDGSLTLLRQLEACHYADGLRVIARTENRGLVAVRNLILEHARHRYLAFVDSDNELVPETMPLFRQALVDTQAAAVYGNLLVRNVGGDTVGVLNNESFQNKVFDANYIDASAMIDRLQERDAGGYSHAAATEDYENWLHLATNGRKLVFVPLVFGYYYRMPLSALAHIDGAATQARLKRIYDQVGARKARSLPTSRLRYHPDIGYL